ncbi:glyoxalase superfamily protein [Phaeobacter sp. JH20_36]|uniref:glyoxalase superfamily protein n=1 Tax=unclassified Phaeobacter TaxID=2621772 RepID=UPI003A872834
MTNSQTDLPPIGSLKQQARNLRAQLQARNHTLSHSAALEMVARQYGYKDWNTISAKADRPRPDVAQQALQIGQILRGSYLGQAFTAELRGLQVFAGGARRRVTLHLEQPVDVVKFDSFSALRQRITGTIGWDGRSAECTSDGLPQLVLELPN